MAQLSGVEVVQDDVRLVPVAIPPFVLHFVVGLNPKLEVFQASLRFVFPPMPIAGLSVGPQNDVWLLLLMMVCRNDGFHYYSRG